MENHITEKWTAGQIAVFIRMYPDDKHKRLSIARRLAGDFPAILADLGEDKARVLEKWLELQGLQVREKRRDSWAEVARLLLRYIRERKGEINPVEVVRVLVWSALGFKP
jgi:hypothetical protein